MAVDVAVNGNFGPREGRRRWLERMAGGGFGLYFAAKIIYLATRIGENIFPDEESWFGIIQLFATRFWPPVDSALSYKFGLISHSPNFYFWLMGRVLSLNFFPLSDLIFLRLVNVGLGLIAIGYGWRLARLLGLGLASALLFLVLLTNTMMFTLLYAAVSYDNFVNLSAILSLYYLLRFFKERRPSAALLALVWSLLGTLTKISFLPYLCGLLILTVVHEWHFWSRLPSGAREFMVRGRFWPNGLLLVGGLLLAALNVNLYGYNWLHYRQWVPGMEQVLPLEACLKYRLFARNYVVEQFKSGKISLLAAQRQAVQIRNPGDRQDALFMLQQAVLERAGRITPRLGALAYTREWLVTMVSRTYGVAAHLVIPREGLSLLPYYLIFLLAGGLGIVRCGRRQMAGFAPYLLGILMFYCGILLFQVSYQSYVVTGLVGVALSGRYLFPVLVPLYLLMAYYLLDKMPRWWQWGIGGLVGVVFVLGEFPWFLHHVTPEWYR